jgi:orotidine-5'-phosphate decarboxylase
MSIGVETSLIVAQSGRFLDFAQMTKAADKIIVALDVATTKEAMGLVAQLRNQISFFKVGLQLYTAAGPEIVQQITATSAKVFLDLKLHDIPSTVAGAVAAAGHLGVHMMSIHLSGGRAMLDAAVAAKSQDLMLLGVTVLTSANAQTLQEIGTDSPVEKQVERLASLGISAGIDGLVASPHEASQLRAHVGPNIRIVTPGVRPKWSEPGDQKRFMTPGEALANGADYLVIGRPITAHANPAQAVAKILNEIPA